MLVRGGDFADGVVRHEADRARCDRAVTFDQGCSSGNSVHALIKSLPKADFPIIWPEWVLRSPLPPKPSRTSGC
jgi:hypothetical protein